MFITLFAFFIVKMDLSLLHFCSTYSPSIPLFAITLLAYTASVTADMVLLLHKCLFFSISLLPTCTDSYLDAPFCIYLELNFEYVL